MRSDKDRSVTSEEAVSIKTDVHMDFFVLTLLRGDHQVTSPVSGALELSSILHLPSPSQV